MNLIGDHGTSTAVTVPCVPFHSRSSGSHELTVSVIPVDQSVSVAGSTPSPVVAASENDPSGEHSIDPPPRIWQSPSFRPSRRNKHPGPELFIENWPVREHLDGSDGIMLISTILPSSAVHGQHPPPQHTVHPEYSVTVAMSRPRRNEALGDRHRLRRDCQRSTRAFHVCHDRLACRQTTTEIERRYKELLVPESKRPHIAIDFAE